MRTENNSLANPGYALAVKDAYKSYDGKTQILDGLQMRVPQGAIYALLGSSGCGKSTILNAIVGLIALDSGQVETVAESKRDLGFMPQQPCLYKQMTIHNILNYFANIYMMDKLQTDSRIKLLYKLLKLPEIHSYLENLSGGQLRRVSLAIALIHNPKILVLDEPTVGVDTILRTSIWEHLMGHCLNMGASVLITTHYNEEAKQAHMIGYMRNGKLLCEDSPAELMAQTGSQCLETVYLTFAHNDANEIRTSKGHGCQLGRNPQLSPLSRIETKLSLKRFKAEFYKNLLFMRRNISVVIYVLSMLPASITFLHFAIRTPMNLNMGIVNEETPFGMTFCNNYKPTKKCELEYLSCKYIKKIKQESFVFDEYKTLSLGIESMKSKGYWGVIYFPSNYSTSLALRLQEFPYVENKTLDWSAAQVHIDSSNYIVYNLIKKELRNGFVKYLDEIHDECGWNKKSASLPINFKTPVYGTNDPDYRDFLAPTALLFVLFGSAMTYGAIVVLEEKNSGSAGRSIVAGASICDILSAHLFVQLGLQLVQTFIGALTTYYIFGYEFNNFLMTILLLILQGISGIALAMLLAIGLQSIASVANIITGITLLTIAISGTFWPLEALHPYIKPISWIAPMTLTTKALRSITYRNSHIDHPDVIVGFFGCIIWTCGVSFITLWLIKKYKANLFLPKSK